MLHAVVWRRLKISVHSAESPRQWKKKRWSVINNGLVNYTSTYHIQTIELLETLQRPQRPLAGPLAGPLFLNPYVIKCSDCACTCAFESLVYIWLKLIIVSEQTYHYCVRLCSTVSSQQGSQHLRAGQKTLVGAFNIVNFQGRWKEWLHVWIICIWNIYLELG